MLIQKLLEARESLPQGMVGDSLTPNHLLVEKLPIRAIAERLRAPDSIAIFVQLLCAEKGALRAPLVMDLIERAQDKQHTLRTWYHTILNPREQLLALGLSFFDGFFDDQFFAAIEKVVERVWQRRDSSLRALDYRDLNNLRDFFSFVEAEGYGIRIESRFPELRRKLFKEAWDSHRRQILVALPVIAQLATDSVAYRSFDPELYGTAIRRDQLRKVISETLSDIGMISNSVVERTLLQLASDENLGVQAVAARALARWHNTEREKELFETLHKWQWDTLVQDWIAAILSGRRDEKEKDQKPESARDYIRATIALTVSYAALYDAPNQLSEELITLLRDLTEDESELVRNRFRQHTLQLVVPRHLIQLRGFLHDTVRYRDLVPAIGASLALAYRDNPDEVIRTLNLWHQECRNTRPARVNPNEITLREKLLATLAMTYGHIQYDQATGPLGADQAFRRMQDILAEEIHPFVRTAVVFAISLQAHKYFEQVEPLLWNLVAEVIESEHDEIVKTLTHIYLEQRRKLAGGDDFLEIEQNRYSIWVDSQRPSTAVELAMLAWIKSPDNPAAQQIATKASVAFARALDQKEAEKIEAIRARRKQLAMEQAQPVSSVTIPIRHFRRASLIEGLAAWLATLSGAGFREIVKGLLPEVLAQKRSNRAAMLFVLSKWRQIFDNEIRTIVRLLSRAISLAENSPLIAILTIGALFFCVCCACFGLSAVRR